MLAAHAPAVPIAAQQAIALRSPQLAYAPASVPSGYRYLRWKWDENASIMRLWFRNAAGKEIVFSSTWQYGKCAASRRQTLRIAGATVYWTHGSRQQQSWRCVPAPGDKGVLVQLIATVAQPAPSEAAVLGRIVAGARHVATR